MGASFQKIGSLITYQHIYSIKIHKKSQFLIKNITYTLQKYHQEGQNYSQKRAINPISQNKSQ